MSNANPYALPTGMDQPQYGNAPASGTLPLASQGQRFVNMFLDSIVIQVLATGGGFVLGLVYGISKASAGQEITQEELGFLNIVGMLFGLFCSVSYYFLMEMIFGKTLGKMASGTRVVNKDGRAPTAGQLFGRTFARYIPFEAFSFFGGKGFPVGWHDSLSGTRVIKTR